MNYKLLNVIKVLIFGKSFRSVMSKPREFAHLIRNKFGSADNINSISSKYSNLFWIV